GRRQQGIHREADPAPLDAAVRPDRRSDRRVRGDRRRQSGAGVPPRARRHEGGPDRDRSRARSNLRIPPASRLSRHLLVMRTLLICHDGAEVDREGLARWLGSFSRFTGTVVIREPAGRLRKRIAREIARVGFWRFLDVLAFRAFYLLTAARGDRHWERRAL